MAVTILLEVCSEPGKLSDLMKFAISLIPETSRQAGFKSIKLFSDIDRLDTMIAIEEWDSREQYQAYLNWRVETGVIRDMLAMAKGEPSIRFLEECKGNH